MKRALLGYMPGDVERCILDLEEKLREAENRERRLWKENRRMEYLCSDLQQKLYAATGKRENQPQRWMSTDEDP